MARTSTKVSVLVLENRDFHKDNLLKKRISTPIKTSKCVHSYGVRLDTNNLITGLRTKTTTHRGKKKDFLNGQLTQQFTSHTSNVWIKELGVDKV